MSYMYIYKKKEKKRKIKKIATTFANLIFLGSCLLDSTCVVVIFVVLSLLCTFRNLVAGNSLYVNI